MINISLQFHAWILHIIMTVIFLFVLYFWGLRTNGDYDFSPLYKALLCVIGYAAYWIVFLALT
jgi:hypothetical protein